MNPDEVDLGQAEAARLWNSLVEPYRNELRLHAQRDTYDFLASCGAVPPALDNELYSEKKFKRCFQESAPKVRAEIVDQLWRRLLGLNLNAPEWLTDQYVWVEKIYQKYAGEKTEIPKIETTRKDVEKALEFARSAVADGRFEEVFLPLTTALQGYLHELGSKLGVDVSHTPHSDLRKILEKLSSELAQAGWERETKSVIHGLQGAVESIYKARGDGDKLAHAERSRNRLNRATYGLCVNSVATLLKFLDDLMQAANPASR